MATLSYEFPGKVVAFSLSGAWEQLPVYDLE
jgi:hypothetical protein